MIQSFADRDTAQLFYQEKSTRYPMLVRIALRKLIQLNRASQLRDLAAPPGNRLAALSGNLRGLYSLRLNDQWRIVFRWTQQGPADVAIKDYH
ncbi:MAG: type II toxin-antitoxin system RelE/ParE family toxin [Opitutae bacterium]|jgi:toxin HigB-1|nr:type II toxin-antitoxin system RelE/ParE family toxin [Opitutae bacterium]